MSLENEDLHLPDQPPTEMIDEIQKKLKISYTRDFLLSLSDLDVCKKLPSGFDRSLLSELEDASLDRQRTAGGLSLNSFRRNEYGSSPPTRGDSTGYNRGVQGRWESRSSGRSDKDGDSQSDWDSESGKRYGNQSRRPWQVPEHDGLLGSGSFPRPSGYAAGASAPKVRQNESYQHNRTTEPYQPPRPYKAVPHLRREGNDSLNDETFGSSDSTSEDRAEEERKRRASFEIMRKEQHKSLQEKQKFNIDKSRVDFDISTLREESKEERKSSGSDEVAIPLGSDNDSEKSSVLSQTPASRPLVPPGFKSTVIDKSLGSKSNHAHAAVFGNSEREDSLLRGKSNSSANAASNDQQEKQIVKEIGSRKQQYESISNRGSIDNHSGKDLDLSSALDVSDKSFGTDSILYNKTNITQAFEDSTISEPVELNAEKVTVPSILGESSQNPSTSILDKLFGSALTLSVAGSSSSLEHHDNSVDETQSPDSVQSSKFAHWFHEEERKPSNNQSTGQPNNLLSLIVGSEKDGSRVSGNTSDNILPNLPFQNSEISEKLMTSDVGSATVGSIDQLYKNNKSQPVSAVLTCEDLEQSILSGIGDNSSIIQPPVQSRRDPDGKTKQPKVNTDDLASQHLLSLLQKGTSLKEMESSSNLDKSSSDSFYDDKDPSIGSALLNSREGKVENVSDSAKSLTLETLFGSAFMKELQSVGAPVSIQRGPVGSLKNDVSDPHRLPFPVVDNFLPSSNDIGFSTTVHDISGLTANKRKQTKFDNIEEQWLSFDNSQAEQNTSHLRTNLGSKVVGFNVPAGVALPEEDSLITASVPLNVENFMPSGNTVKTEMLSSANPQVDFVEKLASFNSSFGDERSIRGGQEPPFLRGPYDRTESSNPYQNLNVQPSFPQLHQQLNNMGPLFHHLDSHPVNVGSQMKFMGPEAATHHDPAPNHQIPVNMLRPSFHHSGPGLSGFDQPIPHPLLQQMHMAGSFSPNLLQGLHRGPSLPTHPNRSAPMPAHPNFGSVGMPQPAPDIGSGSNHPEAFQRLIEMELRSNSKQIHPFATGGGGPGPGPGGHSHGMYGHELDMGFGFR
ncbi:uncharacterized protein LOC133796763 isoform X2 [Humulus lupulus]|uniref:uncharacterized protein LOC133796763 isoform X2 n=1 Tax=Humulus lupulus TaxID=3486 RepID=UPI002B412698|nr:uncharacterized protein LOC133796763 isoform X2 [Humulus lupulus]